MRKGDLDELGTGGFELLGRGFNFLTYGWIDALAEVFLGQAKLEAGDPVVQTGKEVGHFGIERGGVA